MQSKRLALPGKVLIALMMSLTLSFSSIASSSQSYNCPELLDECSMVVGKQQLTIQKQEQVIKTQEELLKTEADEIKRLDKEVKTTKKIAWGSSGLLLLLLLL